MRRPGAPAGERRIAARPGLFVELAHAVALQVEWAAHNRGSVIGGAVLVGSEYLVEDLGDVADECGRTTPAGASLTAAADALRAALGRLRRAGR